MEEIKSQGRPPEEKRMPHARWQLVVVEFTTANFDKVIPHTLNPINPEDVKWEVMDRNQPGTLYRGAKAAGTDYVVLRTDIIGTFHIRLYIPAHYDPLVTPKLKPLTYTPTPPLTLAQVFAAIYPIGSIYFSNNSTNPATTLGFGTWVAFGAGKVPVGFANADADFGVDEATGGEKTHVLTIAELAVHNHNITDPGHFHTFTTWTQTNEFQSNGAFAIPTTPSTPNTGSATTGITINNTGSGTAHNNLQPFIVVRMWKRTG